jgi:hypothetical protein
VTHQDGPSPSRLVIVAFQEADMEEVDEIVDVYAPHWGCRSDCERGVR